MSIFYKTVQVLFFGSNGCFNELGGTYVNKGKLHLVMSIYYSFWIVFWLCIAMSHPQPTTQFVTGSKRNSIVPVGTFTIH